MHFLEIKGDWKITKDKLKQTWTRLTEDDLHYADGEYDELVDRIHLRTGASRETIEKVIRLSVAGCGRN